jgi:glycosyltransferase 2 family protein
MATSHAQGREPAPRSWRRSLTWLSGILILALVVLIAIKFSELERFAEIARNAQPIWLLAAFVLQALTYVCAAGVWQATLRRAGVRVRFSSIVPLGLAKLFTDQTLPTGGIGGAVLVVTGLERRGVPKRIGMAALLMGLISYYVAYVTAVIAALLILYSQRSLSHAMIVAAALFGFIAIAIPTIVLRARHWLGQKSGHGPTALIKKWLNRIPGLSALTSAFSKAPSDLLRSPLSLAVAIVLQIMVFTLDAGTLWVMLKATGVEASLAVAIAAFVMASLAATVAPMPLGLGTFEAVCVTMLHIQGLSVETALTATLLLRGFTFWLPMLPGLLLARWELSQLPAEERARR